MWPYKLWPVNLTFQLDLINRAGCQRKSRLVQTLFSEHTRTHQTDCSTGPVKWLIMTAEILGSFVKMHRRIARWAMGNIAVYLESGHLLSVILLRNGELKFYLHLSLTVFHWSKKFHWNRQSCERKIEYLTLVWGSGNTPLHFTLPAYTPTIHSSRLSDKLSQTCLHSKDSR